MVNVALEKCIMRFRAIHADITDFNLSERFDATMSLLTLLII